MIVEVRGCMRLWTECDLDVELNRQLFLAPVLNEKYLRYRDRAINEYCREWIFNKRQLQSAVSRFCGHYCVCFCILRSRDISLPSFFDLLTLSAIQDLTMLWSIVCCVK